MQTTSTPQQTKTTQGRPRHALREVRRAQGLSLRRAATLAKIDASHLSRVERGEAYLSLDALARLGDVLGLRQLTEFLEPYRPSGNGDTEKERPDDKQRAPSGARRLTTREAKRSRTGGTSRGHP